MAGESVRIFPPTLMMGRCHFHQKARLAMQAADRKSTRLNSSHLVISYAVFCLKKKKQLSYPHAEPRDTVARPAHHFLGSILRDRHVRGCALHRTLAVLERSAPCPDTHDLLSP